jgi:signal transduction histidine kinase/ligand-binding sensor domain-containing protein/CheY-like chemotaxis protein
MNHIVVHRRTLLPLLVMLTALCVQAQQYRLRHFGPDDGLPAAVSHVIQDRTGFLWVGTSNGLYRYDGGRFRAYGTSDGLPAAGIRGLADSPDGTVWALTSGGLAYSSGDGFRPVPAAAAGSAIRSLAIGADGRMFVGSERGLFSAQLPLKAGDALAAVPGVPPRGVTGLYVEPGGDVWFGCGPNLCQLREGRLRMFDESSGLPGKGWTTILRARSGDLWVRNPRHLYRLPRGESRFEARDRDLVQASNGPVSMIEDRQGLLLVGTDRGVARLVDGKWEYIGYAQGLQSEAVTTLLEDREGSIWIGLWGSGLARWPSPSEWTAWSSTTGSGVDIVWCFARDRTGTLWVGTDRGLVRFGGPSGTRLFTSRDGLPGDKVRSLLVGPDGAIWAGSFPGGVARLDPRTQRIEAIPLDAGLEDARPMAMHLDSQDRLWVASRKGLYRSVLLGSKPRFQRQSLPGAAPDTFYFRFLSDSKGRLWVTSNEGLFRLEGDSWTRLTSADGLLNTDVGQITELGDGAYWVSYREALGITRLAMRDGKTEFRHFTQRDGLPGNFVLFLGKDASHRLWVGTDSGVAVQTPSGWSVYTREDGLAWDRCSTGAFLSEADGSVWVGTLRGFSRYRPSGQMKSPPPPPMRVLSLRFGDKPASPPEGFAKVPFSDRDVAIAFTGLTFLHENIRFRYRLTGKSDRWIETTQRDVHFPDVAAGTYRFEVTARHPNGQWNPVPASVSFRIVPPWYATWWFRLLFGGCVVGAVISTVYTRARRARLEHQRLERAVTERTAELRDQKEVVERQNREIESLLDRAREMSRLKSEFLANMSHEIRTPMNGILGMTQLALQTKLDTEQRDYVATINEAAQSLLVIINDILDFSKVEAGKMELAREPFRLESTVSSAVAVLGWKAQEKRLTLGFEIEPGIPEVVAGDEGRLRQILLNLIGNSIKFTEHGEVGLSVRRCPGPEVTLQFTVRDTGIGVPAEFQERIFDSFTQADGSTRRKGGTGLGLAICSKFVELMGGRIWLESEPGKGSRFHFTARFEPVADPRRLPNPVPLPRMPDQAAGAALRILLAEDNPINQKLAKRAIEKMGHSVHVASNGLLAAEEAARQTFDLILMDLQMPEMDGFESAATIRKAESPLGRHTPIVAMTAHAMQGDRENCLLSGFDDYISKPVDLQVLARTIEQSRTRPPA